MDRARLSRLLAGLLVLWAADARAQTQIDLAATLAGDTISINPGSLSLVVANRLRARTYRVTVNVEAVPIPPLPPVQLPVRETVATAPCQALIDATGALSSSKDEAEVAQAVREIERRLSDAKCADVAVVTAARDAVNGTRRVLDPLVVASGEQVKVTIERLAMDGNAVDKTWTVTFSTGARGQWLTTYGFAFIPDRDERYFSKAAGANAFVITKERDAGGLTPAPSVFFSWLSRKAALGNWSISPTAGLGLTDKLPSVFGGVSVLFNQNIGVAAGIGLYAQKRLNGRYAADQQIEENLGDDQLHRVVYLPNVMVAATYRFGSNPFEKKAGDSAAPDKPAPEKPAPNKPAVSTQPPATPGTPPALANAERGGSQGPNGYRVSFTEQGALAPASVAERDRAIAAVAAATDVFVFSHGWWNNARSAECLYTKMIGGLQNRTPATLGGANFRPIFVGIYWPSAVFPLESGDCSTGPPTPAPVESHVDPFAQGLQEWAREAFPAAAGRPEFARQLDRAIILFDRDRVGASLTAAEAQELVALLQSWRDAGAGPASVSEAPDPEMFSGTPTDVLAHWAGQNPRAEGFSLSKALNLGNAFTFWTMKQRAGTVGSHGLYDLLRAVRQRGGPQLKIHVIGHSFGGKLVSAGIKGAGQGSMNLVDSLIILQGAFSHFAFSSAAQMRALGIESKLPGLYADVLGNSMAARQVRGPIVVTFSSQDLPNQSLYPLGVALVGDFREGNRPSKYGSVGADGLQGPTVETITLGRERAASKLTRASTIVNVNASGVITGHSDLIHNEVLDLIWDVVLAVHAGN
jgi:pimeloyl-ACP methyl ester carboxylesterase